ADHEMRAHGAQRFVAGEHGGPLALVLALATQRDDEHGEQQGGRQAPRKAAPPGQAAQCQGQQQRRFEMAQPMEQRVFQMPGDAEQEQGQKMGGRPGQVAFHDSSRLLLSWAPRRYQLRRRVASMVVARARKSRTLPISSALSSESRTP